MAIANKKFDITNTHNANQIVGLKRIILKSIPEGVKCENVIIALSDLAIGFAEVIRDDDETFYEMKK